MPDSRISRTMDAASGYFASSKANVCSAVSHLASMSLTLFARSHRRDSRTSSSTVDWSSRVQSRDFHGPNTQAGGRAGRPASAV